MCLCVYFCLIGSGLGPESSGLVLADARKPDSEVVSWSMCDALPGMPMQLPS